MNFIEKANKIFDYLLDKWRRVLLFFFLPLAKVEREKFLSKLFSDDYEEIGSSSPCDVVKMEEVRQKAQRIIKHHLWFTVAITFLAAIPQSLYVVIACIVIDFVQTQIVTITLTEKLQFMYFSKEDLSKKEPKDLLEADKEIKFWKKMLIRGVGMFFKQSLKFGARLLIVRIFLLNIIKQVCKWMEMKIVSRAEIEGILELSVSVATALITGFVAWIIFSAMMKSHHKRLEGEYLKKKKAV